MKIIAGCAVTLAVFLTMHFAFNAGIAIGFGMVVMVILTAGE